MKKFTSQLTLSYSETGNRRTKAASRTSANSRTKRTLYNSPDYQCAVCGWKEPKFLNNLRANCTLMMLELHHVLPASMGGNDEPENLLLLCPNHHSIADYLSQNKHRQLFANTGLFDPHNKTSLLHALKSLDRNPDKWWREIQKAFDTEQRKATESIAAILDSE